jgi:hypothetical protein
MIQRIQSIYLTLVIVLSILLFNISVLNFNDETGRLLNLRISGNLTDQSGQIISKSSSMLLVIAFLILICIISVITILLYRNRKRQLLLVKIMIFLSAGVIAGLSWNAWNIVSAEKMTLMPGFNMVLHLLILLFSLLAHRGILKDDRLVKSYDRLR